MREAFQYWAQGVRLTWQHLCWLVHRIRGVTRDRSGRWYWYLERENRPGHYEIRLFRFPGLTNRASHRNNAGRADVGVRSDSDPSIWMLFYVRVPNTTESRASEHSWSAQPFVWHDATEHKHSTGWSRSVMPKNTLSCLSGMLIWGSLSNDYPSLTHPHSSP